MHRHYLITRNAKAPYPLVIMATCVENRKETKKVPQAGNEGVNCNGNIAYIKFFNNIFLFYFHTLNLLILQAILSIIITIF